MQPDGKVVVLNNVVDPNAPYPGPPQSFSVDRFNTDGSLDSAFGAGGRASLSFPVPQYLGGGIAVQPDGKIVVAGTCGEGNNGFNDLTDFCVERLTSTGALDMTFGGGDGSAYPIWGLTKIARAFNVALQPDGKILVVGLQRNAAAIVRLLPSGSLDPTFGKGGRKTLGAGALVGAVTQGTKIVVIGRFHDPATPPDLSAAIDWGVARLWPKGGLDSSFGMGGKVYSPVPNQIWGDSGAFGIALTSGKIVVVGYVATHGTPESPDRDSVIARYLSA